jgi:putative chitinase
MAELTEAQLGRIMPRVSDTARWTAALNGSMQEFGIVSLQRIAAFLAQIAHESSELRRLVEGLSYSAKRLCATWPKRFETEAAARPYERQPERLANFVYANRMGNEDEASGDGWRFRGRGILQTTGRSNYRSAAAALGLPLEGQPDLLEQPLPAARAAAFYWQSNRLNELADLSGDRVHDDEDFELITRRINGGTAGLTERKRYWSSAKAVLGIG